MRRPCTVYGKSSLAREVDEYVSYIPTPDIMTMALKHFIIRCDILAYDFAGFVHRASFAKNSQPEAR